MKIVILGGGTAGWLAASFLAEANLRYKKDGGNLKYDITLIESNNIPTIGAGEGSTGLLVDIVTKRLASLGINENDFIKETKATLKLGIRFKDWNGVGTEYLSPINPTSTTGAFIDLDLNVFKAFGNYSDANLCGYLLGRGYSSCKTDNKTLTALHAYHFDSHNVGMYLRKICERHDVKRIEGDVIKLNKNYDTGDLNYVTLESGDIIESDYWIDCSGMNATLIKEMDNEWVDYSKYLPVNSAIPYIHQYKRDEDIKAETLAHALPNGWMWQIPTQERYGCGYVYSDNHITYENAVSELMKVTGRQIEPLRNIKFKCGRVKNFWVNNVICAGLSSGFLEPLQATSIHITIVQLETFINNYLSPINMETEFGRKKYNSFISKLVDDFKDLIQIHYMTKRNDSDFWKFINNDLEKTDKTKFILETTKHRSLSFFDFENYLGCAGWSVWGWTLFGLDIITKETSINTIKKHGFFQNSNKVFDNINRFNEIKKNGFIKNKDYIKLISK